MKGKSPKILPWLAKREGIPLARAEELWTEAVRHATLQADIVESPAYWQAAVDHLQRGIAAEAQQRRSAPFGLGHLVRLPARLWLQCLEAQQAQFAAATDRWWRQRVC